MIVEWGQGVHCSNDSERCLPCPFKGNDSRQSSRLTVITAVAEKILLHIKRTQRPHINIRLQQPASLQLKLGGEREIDVWFLAWNFQDRCVEVGVGECCGDFVSYFKMSGTDARADGAEDTRIALFWVFFKGFVHLFKLKMEGTQRFVNDASDQAAPASVDCGDCDGLALNDGGEQEGDAIGDAHGQCEALGRGDQAVGGFGGGLSNGLKVALTVRGGVSFIDHEHATAMHLLDVNQGVVGAICGVEESLITLEGLAGGGVTHRCEVPFVDPRRLMVGSNSSSGLNGRAAACLSG